MNLKSSKIFTTTVVLQSLFALLAWLQGGFVFLVSGPGIDADKPSHQVSVAQRLGETLLVCGPPVLVLTLAAILIWRRRVLGWWLCVLGDFLIAAFGLVLLCDDSSWLVD